MKLLRQFAACRWLKWPRWFWGDEPLYVVILLAVTFGTAVLAFRVGKWFTTVKGACR